MGHTHKKLVHPPELVRFESINTYAYASSSTSGRLYIAFRCARKIGQHEGCCSRCAFGVSQNEFEHSRQCIIKPLLYMLSERNRPWDGRGVEVETGFLRWTIHATHSKWCQRMRKKRESEKNAPYFIEWIEINSHHWASEQQQRRSITCRQ